MEEKMYFEQCMDFLARMIEKYGANIKLPGEKTDDNNDNTAEYDTAA